MTKLKNIIGEYSTTFGHALVIEPQGVISVGDLVVANGHEYRVESVIMPTRPNETERITLIVSE